MRKLKSFTFIALTAFAITACSGSKDVEQRPEQELYNVGQTHLQNGDYSPPPHKQSVIWMLSVAVSLVVVIVNKHY